MTLGWQPVPRSARVLAAGMVAASAGLVWTVHQLPVVEGLVLGHPSFCAMKVLFGIPCVACRGTRAVFALAHGDAAGAVQFNPLGTLLVASCLGLAVSALITGRIPALREIARPWQVFLWCLLLAAVLGNWAYVIQAGG
jgi:hypothetical protein